MGKLTIEGKASKEYAYDLMNISVEFWATEGSAAAALKRVTEQSEEFLAILEKAGIAPESVRIGEDSTAKRSYDSRFQIEAKRELTLRAAFNMDFANFIHDTVQKNALDAEVNVTYKFSDLEAIHKELLQLALEDSKAKAESITQMMGQKLVGIDSVTLGSKQRRSDFYPDKPLFGTETDDGYYGCALQMLSRRVQAPVSMESDSVEVVWLIE